MMISRTDSTIFILITLIFHLIFIKGQHNQNAKCDDTVVNMHMLQCYKNNIDEKLDVTSPENAYFMDGNLLCQAYNKSSSYRQCLYSIFDPNDVCSFILFPYSYQYSKIYWKLIMSACTVENNNNCSPSRINQQVLNKCHYSFDDKFPTKCKEFLRSIKCLERYEMELIPSTYGSNCSRNKASYYYYGDLAARIQLAMNICENNLTF
ncbi:unnamed protein product [Rotaria magnacalcarata]|uniref:DUF19 domain-containing protein n=3 Tax=Rotaria magnacalcarata TaxID=392030 RepID=A0A816PY63_9BILA|nr:unnamed protein product [Rotaria magnacalcarata]CAF2054285.1 unnamed protein product [Rotaria magnacalcarata]CAF2075950.1 unnamed protein product [Rotaria magnacalcarata]CAF2210435.1 unnamed protein product [Rotaria magnacalcarata]